MAAMASARASLAFWAWLLVASAPCAAPAAASAAPAVAGDVLLEAAELQRDGIWLYQQAGGGKLWVPAGDFSPDPYIGHGGGASWDACTRATYDNGVPLWSPNGGSSIGSFRITGHWHLRAGRTCGSGTGWPRPDLSQEYTAAHGIVRFTGLAHLEEVVDGVWLFQTGGGGRLFLPAGSFAPNRLSGRGGVAAWDVCGASQRFDNGEPLWTPGGGSRVGSFRVVGGWLLRAGTGCGKSASLQGMRLGRETSEANEVVELPGLAYLEQAVDGVELFEQGGGGRLLVTADSFSPNFESGRGGAPGWDACGGGAFDNGEPLWSPSVGSRVGAFEVTGSWKVRSGNACSKTLGSSGTRLSDPVAAGGPQTFPGLAYVEAVVDGVELYEQGGSGVLFVPAALFTFNANSGRGGASAWDACAGWEFDNGDEVWLEGQGSRVVGFKVIGDWRVRAAKQCGKTFDYPELELSGPRDASTGQNWMPGLLYLESATPGVRRLGPALPGAAAPAMAAGAAVPGPAAGPTSPAPTQPLFP